MQSATFTLTPSLRLPKPRRPSASPAVNSRFDPIRVSASSKPNNFNDALSASLPRRSWSLSSSSSDFKLRSWTSVPLVDSDAGAKRFEVRATTETADESTESGSSLLKTLELGALFGLWFLFNIWFNIYDKQVLKVFPYPVTVTGIQFVVGTVLVLLMWGLNLYKKSRVSGAQLAAILPLAIVHTLVILSAMFLGEIPTPWVVASLIPIVGGVGLASITEVSFNWAGFWSAMASNLTNQSRNVLSKKVMVKKEANMDNITLCSVITVMSFFLLTPVGIFMEGVKFTPAVLQSAGLNVKQVYIRSFIAALCFHAYQQVSYMILQRVSPVTHSVGNCVKRVVVIVSSVLFFRTPVSPINALGTGVALAGVFLYSRVKRIKSKPKSA